MITCPNCGMISHNPNDERERYCSNCNQSHDHMTKPIALNKKGFDEIMSHLSRKQRSQFVRAAKQLGCRPEELLNDLIAKGAKAEPKLRMTLVPLVEKNRRG